MNTVQIDHALRSWLKTQSRIPHTTFKGTFALNQLPYVYTLDPPFASIVNTEPLDQEGDHWIAVFRSKDGPIEFFDTRGFPNDYTYTDHILSQMSLSGEPQYIFNMYNIQSMCSSVCGEYCIALVYFRLLGVSFESFLKCFSTTDLVRNDKRIYAFVHNTFDILPHERVIPAFSSDVMCRRFGLLGI